MMAVKLLALSLFGWVLGETLLSKKSCSTLSWAKVGPRFAGWVVESAADLPPDEYPAGVRVDRLGMTSASLRTPGASWMPIEAAVRLGLSLGRVFVEPQFIAGHDAWVLVVRPGEPIPDSWMEVVR